MNRTDKPELENYELIVLGGGIAGITAAILAAKQGKTTALICNQVGGNYVYNGCLDARYLYENAKTIRHCINAKERGIVLGSLSLDMEKMMQDKNKHLVYTEFEMEKELSKAGVRVFEGVGRPMPTGMIDVMDSHKEQRRLKWQKLIIATGAKSVHRDVFKGFDSVLTDEDILNLDYVPQELTILGEGANACEIASIYAVMGSRATIISDKTALLEGLDAQIIGRLEEQMKKRGIQIYYKAQPVDLYKDSLGSIHIEVDREDHKRETIISSDIYIASQRSGNFAGLDALRLNTDNGKIAVNDFGETSVQNVYAAGEVTPACTTADQSVAMARMVAHNSVDEEDPWQCSHFSIPTCIHTFPEIASIGLDTKTASQFYEDVRIGLAPLGADVGDLFVEDKQGFVKVLVDGQYFEILGVHIIGENASELIGQAQAIMATEGTALDALKLVHPHPSLSQALQNALEKIEK